MLTASFQLTNTALDELIASYGIIEDVNTNKEYLKESIDLAREVVGCDGAYVSILNSTKQYIITSHGLNDFPKDRNRSICQLTVRNVEPTVITDVSKNPDLTSLNVETSEMKFYAGFPLINTDGVVIGALCTSNREDVQLSDHKIRILQMIAQSIVVKFDNRRSLISLIKEINENFEPSACKDYHCLSSELSHLQNEVLSTSEKLKSQQRELQTTNQKLSKFAHRIAHDLKAPLRSINGFSQLIKMKLDKQDVDFEQSYFDNLKISTLEMHRMIDNVLSIAEMKAEVVREKVSISEILNKVELFLADTIQTNKVQFIKPNHDVLVMGYKDLLHQLFQNIISNAIKYRSSDRPALVEVTFEPLESKVLVKVSDNGIGISEEHMKDILKPFKRVDNDTEVAGLGIGLDTCNIIVQDMGSALSVESKEGQGSTFSFELPYNA